MSRLSTGGTHVIDDIIGDITSRTPRFVAPPDLTGRAGLLHHGQHPGQHGTKEFDFENDENTFDGREWGVIPKQEMGDTAGKIQQRVWEKYQEIKDTITDPGKALNAAVKAVTGIDFAEGKINVAQLAVFIGTGGAIAGIIAGITTVADFLGFDVPRLDLGYIRRTVLGADDREFIPLDPMTTHPSDPRLESPFAFRPKEQNPEMDHPNTIIPVFHDTGGIESITVRTTRFNEEGEEEEKDFNLSLDDLDNLGVTFSQLTDFDFSPYLEDLEDDGQLNNSAGPNKGKPFEGQTRVDDEGRTLVYKNGEWIEQTEVTTPGDDDNDGDVRLPPTNPEEDGPLIPDIDPGGPNIPKDPPSDPGDDLFPDDGGGGTTIPPGDLGGDDGGTDREDKNETSGGFKFFKMPEFKILDPDFGGELQANANVKKAAENDDDDPLED